MGSVRDSGRSQIWGGDGLRRRQRRPGWHLVAFPNGGSDSPGDGAMIQWRGRAGSAAIDSGGDRKARTGDLALGNNSNEMDMKRAAPWEQSHDISSDDSLSSDSEDDAKKKKDNTFGLPNSSKGAVAEGALIRRAEMYQEYMKHIPVPAHRCSVIPYTSWLELAGSMKQLYGQPLHYLTNILLKQWDQQRIGSDDEHRPLDAIIHPVKAEALIWVTEEVHRFTTSSHHLARLWASDPMYHAYIDPMFPSITLP